MPTKFKGILILILYFLTILKDFGINNKAKNTLRLAQSIDY